MNDSPDLTAFRDALVAERVRLLASLGEPIEGPGQMTYGSQAAAATHVFEQQRDLALRDHERAQLVLVGDALARLADGTFGTCLSCGRQIAPARLEAIPWVALCIDCARMAGK
ncbi:MAG: TraR/DksA family transcriptional regulator [Chloroflexi bacterium]|nr:TraR/DksA family transcriptional regulator [Chloroflexota bacterium]